MTFSRFNQDTTLNEFMKNAPTVNHRRKTYRSNEFTLDDLNLSNFLFLSRQFAEKYNVSDKDVQIMTELDEDENVKIVFYCEESLEQNRERIAREEKALKEHNETIKDFQMFREIENIKDDPHDLAKFISRLEDALEYAKKYQIKQYGRPEDVWDHILK